MSDFRHALKKAGYDQVEAYFYQKDLELIEKLREPRKAGSSPPQQSAKVISLDAARTQLQSPPIKKVA